MGRRSFEKGHLGLCAKRKSRRNIMKAYFKIRKLENNVQPLTEVQNFEETCAGTSTSVEIKANSNSTSPVLNTSDIKSPEKSITEDTAYNTNLEFDITLKNDTISGRRIVDMNFLFEQILNSEEHTPFGCSIINMVPISEKRNGLISTFGLKCKMCNIVKYIETERKATHMNINSSVVLGAVSTGIGFSQLEQVAASINMPMMSDKTYISQHEQLAPFIYSSVLETIQEAAKNEADIARDLGEVDENGIPCITVVADGAWSKRSYNVNYDAASGVGCIIGYRTGKILYLGVRNKYCCVCDYYVKKEIDVKSHICYKNWTGSSTSMEADIIVSGFLSSLEMHGLKYTALVGDGDSSVHGRLIDKQPYGPSTVIRKIECRNHLLRNLFKKLRELCKKTKSTSTNEPVSPYLRKQLENNILRMRVSITSALKYRVNEDVSEDNKIQNLKSDILNIPSHIFGEHRECTKIGYFKCKKENVENLVPAMKSCGLYRDIEICMRRLLLNTDSLIKNMDNNLAEHYNSIICKFVGGKRINYSRRGSYQLRCEAAALSYNVGPEYFNTLYKSKIGQHTKKYVEKLRKRKITYSKISIDRKRRRQELRHKKTVAPVDLDYGLLEQPDLEQEEYEEIEKKLLTRLKLTEQQISELEEKTRLQSTTSIWMEERKLRITASNFSKICKLRKTTSSINTIKSLLYSKFKTSATEYGKIHEPYAIQEFSKVTNIQVKSCGLFVHRHYFFLGASPDGLIGNDSVIEVKCPETIKNMHPTEAIISKKIKWATIDNGELQLNRNHMYYYQVQGQLEVANKEICYFVLWSPKGLLIEKIPRDKNFWNIHMCDKLQIFFYNCLLPELVDPRFPRGLPIRDNQRNEIISTK